MGHFPAPLGKFMFWGMYLSFGVGGRQRAGAALV